MSTLDIALIASLLPLLILVASYWLPWDRFAIRVSKRITGPYCLYAAFVLWHLEFDGWITLSALILGIAASVSALLEWKSRKA